MKKNFKVADDGTIDRTDSFNEERRASLDKEILDIIEVNSYSKKFLSAYKGRKLANEICKAKYTHKNYKEYVEMLMHKKYPKEAEKARLGASFVLLNWIALPLFLTGIFFSILCAADYEDIMALPIISTILIVILYVLIIVNIIKKTRSI